MVDYDLMAVTKEYIKRIQTIIPEVMVEGKIDFDQLRVALGEEVESRKEKYEFHWYGKRNAMKLAQTPSTGTLRPNRDKSINWEKTKNVYIEGDNLEVLKLLQKAYFEGIKLIYIDPPYNTGKDFVYKDNFHDNIRNYKYMTGQAAKINPETSGRYHIDWLNMMYPRLKLARNLLTSDGLIFISISDKELANLKKVCDEIFGEENFVANLIWDRNHSAQAGIFKVYHEYVLVYAKNIEQVKVPRSTTKERFEAGAMKRHSNRHSLKDFTFPKGTRFDAHDGTELRGEWGGVEKVVLKKGRMIAQNGMLIEDIILRAAFTQYDQMHEYFYGDREKLTDSRGQRIVEFYFNSAGKIKIVKERSVFTPPTTLRYGTQRVASLELANLFDSQDIPLDSPKPIEMIKDFIAWFTDKHDIVLDLFSGSATTAHSVMKLNAEDDGKRSFIMVQLPEKVNKGDFETICDIGRERIKLAGKKLMENSHDEELDIGFKAFTLDLTNIKPSDPADHEVKS